jgi:hypothetical protein
MLREKCRLETLKNKSEFGFNFEIIVIFVGHCWIRAVSCTNKKLLQGCRWGDIGL